MLWGLKLKLVLLQGGLGKQGFTGSFKGFEGFRVFCWGALRGSGAMLLIIITLIEVLIALLSKSPDPLSRGFRVGGSGVFGLSVHVYGFLGLDTDLHGVPSIILWTVYWLFCFLRFQRALTGLQKLASFFPNYSCLITQVPTSTVASSSRKRASSYMLHAC